MFGTQWDSREPIKKIIFDKYKFYNLSWAFNLSLSKYKQLLYILI